MNFMKNQGKTYPKLGLEKVELDNGGGMLK